MENQAQLTSDPTLLAWLIKRGVSVETAAKKLSAMIRKEPPYENIDESLRLEAAKCAVGIAVDEVSSDVTDIEINLVRGKENEQQ